MRGATRTTKTPLGFALISIHAPHAGSDIGTPGGTVSSAGFQSTLPMRGATGRFQGCRRLRPGFQSTLPMRGAT